MHAITICVMIIAMTRGQTTTSSANPSTYPSGSPSHYPTAHPSNPTNATFCITISRTECFTNQLIFTYRVGDIFAVEGVNDINFICDQEIENCTYVDAASAPDNKGREHLRVRMVSLAN
eukprot:192187_1